jgi:alpha-beta hydrolase superfamily lysophospholipase
LLGKKLWVSCIACRFQFLGHCFGAVPATAFACEQPSLLASLILATPAIYTRAEPSTAEKLKIVWSALSGHDLRIPVSLKAEWFTDQEKYVRFIETDPLTLRDASARLYWETLRARKFIHANESKLTMPLMAAVAGRDRICDNEKDRRFFDRLPSDRKEWRLYPRAVHILEFSSEKNAFLAALTKWLGEPETGITVEQA